MATVAFLHAHPDDEAILTGGTIARLASEAHRVVVITATDGAAGLTDGAQLGDRDLAQLRRAELEMSAKLLGVSRLVHLGYGDSGLDGQGTPSTIGLRGTQSQPFASVPVDVAAVQVAEILRDEGADAIIGYDAAGGYGHPDHVHVHHVARAAAAVVGTPLLLEASLPRELIATAVRWGHAGRRLLPALGGLDVAGWQAAYSARPELTHKIDTRSHLPAKRAALRAHASQASAESGPRTVDVMLRMPVSMFSLLFGTEWYIGPRNPRDRWYRHPLSSLVGELS